MCFTWEEDESVGSRRKLESMKGRTWVKLPAKASKPKASAEVKAQVQKRADELIESVLKPEHVKPPPSEGRFNYIVDIHSRWHGSSFYFCAKYRCPAPECIMEFLELKFARMECAGPDRYNPSYMRHTEKWFELYRDMSLDDCLAAIRDEPHFLP